MASLEELAIARVSRETRMIKLLRSYLRYVEYERDGVIASACPGGMTDHPDIGKMDRAFRGLYRRQQRLIKSLQKELATHG